MKIRQITALFLVLLLLPVGAARGEDPFFGIYGVQRLLRPSAGMLSGQVLAQVPPGTALKLEPDGTGWAKTSYLGVSGYIHLDGMRRLDMADPEGRSAEAMEGVIAARTAFLGAPCIDGRRILMIPAGSRLRLIPVSGEYGYTIINGQPGYVPLDQLNTSVVFERTETEPALRFFELPAALLESPCYGAAMLAELPEQTPLTVIGTDGGYTVIRWQDGIAYTDARPQALPAETAVTPFPVRISRNGQLLSMPLTGSDPVSPVTPSQTGEADAFAGLAVHVRVGQQSGWLPLSSLQPTDAAGQQTLTDYRKGIQEKRLLKLAFSTLEEGNLFAAAWSEKSGETVTAQWKYGCPYLWAGRRYLDVLAIRHPSSSSKYYDVKKWYLGGFDCIGYLRWLQLTAGYPSLPAISETKLIRSKNVDVSDLRPEKWQERLKPGDCVSMGYIGGGYHIMMYIGTLRDYGLASPELTPYTDYPLVIHCGMNPFHTQWYAGYIADMGLADVEPPDGGVTVSILNVPADSIPFEETLWTGTPNEKTFRWFDLQGYQLTVIDLNGSNVGWYTVYRNE